jgi:hypothetical protein
MDLDTVKAKWFGPMVPAMKDSGAMVNQQITEFLNLQTVIFMKAHGHKIRCTVQEKWLTLMVQFIWVNGA